MLLLNATPVSHTHESWVFGPKEQKVISNCFSIFIFMQTPLETGKLRKIGKSLFPFAAYGRTQIHSHWDYSMTEWSSVFAKIILFIVDPRHPTFITSSFYKYPHIKGSYGVPNNFLGWMVIRYGGVL